MWPFIGMAVAQGVSSIFQGRAQAKQYAGQAALAKSRARYAEADRAAAARETPYLQTQALYEGLSELGAATVQTATQGAMSGVGAPFKVRAQRMWDVMSRVHAVGAEGRAKEAGFAAEAKLQTMQKKLFRKAGRDARIGGFLGAGASAFTAAALYGKFFPSGGGQINSPGIIEARDTGVSGIKAATSTVSAASGSSNPIDAETGKPYTAKKLAWLKSTFKSVR